MVTGLLSVGWWLEGRERRERERGKAEGGHLRCVGGWRREVGGDRGSRQRAEGKGLKVQGVRQALRGWRIEDRCA